MILPYTLLIGIITKNNESTIKDVLKNVESYSSLFKTSYTLIIEGYSKDKTFSICKDWCKNDLNRKVMRQPNKFYPRPISLQEARNTIICFYEERFNKDTYLLLLDADDINSSPVDVNSFLTCFKNYDVSTWDAMFANQTKEYYDIWALRSEDCPYDCWQMVKRFGDEWSYLRRHQIPKVKDHPLVSVNSAFGGSAIYNTRNMELCRYNSYVNNIEICEHVPFNEELVKRGYKLFINPAWINK
jgi:hypothetical protein